MLHTLSIALPLGVSLVTGAAAQDLPKTQFKVVGLNGPTPVSIYDELPFWRKHPGIHLSSCNSTEKGWSAESSPAMTAKLRLA